MKKTTKIINNIKLITIYSDHDDEITLEKNKEILNDTGVKITGPEGKIIISGNASINVKKPA